jgi:hypothetical protein
MVSAPVRSVTVIIMLLKEANICAIPILAIFIFLLLLF